MVRWGCNIPYICIDGCYTVILCQEKLDYQLGGIIVNRAERRRIQKNEQKAKTVTYNVTKAQLDAMVEEQIGEKIAKVKAEATLEAVNSAMVLMLALPLEVLMDFYWKKSYAKRIPEFTEHVLDYYEKWANGELDMDELKKDLWEYGGIKLMEGNADG